MSDYSPVQTRLPVLEESITQIAPGRFAVDVAIVSADDVTLYKGHHSVPSVGVTVMDPAYMAFVVARSTSGEECLINGEPASNSTLHMPGPEGSFHVRGSGREVIGITVRRDDFAEMIAALRGIDLDEVTLADHVLEFAPGVVPRLHAILANIADEVSCGHDAEVCSAAPRDVANVVLGLVTDAYLAGYPRSFSQSRWVQSPQQTVRKAEERFLAAPASQISLADLCKAAGVSKSTLYQAFHGIYGLSPLAYFHKRRLMQARSSLISSSPERGAVKRAALGVGLTEMGRFSVEYRKLFGESPLATLNSC